MYEAVVEKWLDAWSGGDLNELDAIVGPDFVRYAPTSLNYRYTSCVNGSVASDWGPLPWRRWRWPPDSCSNGGRAGAQPVPFPQSVISWMSTAVVRISLAWERGRRR